MNRLRNYFILIILFLGCIKTSGQQSVLSQQFSFQFKQLPLEAALDTITQKTGYSFSYNSALISNIKVVNANYTNQPLHDILRDIFKGLELNFKEVCNYIAITRKLSDDDTPDLFTSYIDSSAYYYIQARVFDRSEKRPVPYANVILKGRNLGTITNFDGNFTFKIPAGCINDSIIVSFIGYKSVAKNISTLENGEIIFIEPVSVELKEVVVKHYEPTALIKLALEKVPSNYSSVSEMQIGFYRETSKQNNDYIVISEAVLKIFKAAYDKNFRNDQVSVYKNRKSPFVKSMDTVLYKLQGGIYNSLMIDLAKHPASFISDDYFDTYDYKFEGVAPYDNGLVYVISFDQKPSVAYPLYKGKIYIDRESLAFVKAEFGISPKGLDYATSILVKKSSSKIKAKVLGANYLVSYTNRDNVWKLHHVREEIKIKVRKKYSFFNSTYHSVSELVITDSDTTSVNRFRSYDLIKPNQVFAEVSDSYDESFWGKFNFIPPEESLEEAYNKIKSAIRENRKD
jgi:hypothetical protein